MPAVGVKDERRLVRSVQKRADEAAADALVRLYYDEIAAYAYRQTADRQAALDLAQNIFISALKAIGGYDERKAGFRTWLYRIATNKIIDYHRSRSKVHNKILNLDDVEVADEKDFTGQLENEDLAARIGAYVGTFEADTQRIFRLKIYGEYTFAEIGVMADMPEATVKSKYYRLLKLLRKEFGDEYYAR